MRVHEGRFADKVAVVTGAAQGIGFATAQRMGLEGACVIVADAAARPAEEALGMLAARGVRAAAAIEDLSRFSGAEAAMRKAQQAFGRIDVLVNNVGGTIWTKPFWHYSENEIRQEIERSFWPPMWCARAAIPALQERGGAIVNIASNAVDGLYRVPYAAAKGAVIALTTTLALELVDFGIRVNCVAPGATDVGERKTPRLARPQNAQEKAWREQFDRLIHDESLFGRRATVDEQAALICFLASDEASHITGETVSTGRRGTSIGKTLGFLP